MPILGQLRLAPTGSTGMKSPVCKLPFTLKLYHTWFNLPPLHPTVASQPVTALTASWIWDNVYVPVVEGVIPANARAAYVERS